MEKTRTVPQAYHVDDITGNEAKPTSLTRIDVLVGNEEGSLELTDASRKALVDLIHGDDAAWRNLLTARNSAPVTGNNAGAKRKRRHSSSNGDNAQARAWCKTPEGCAEVDRLRIHVPERGVMPRALVEAWRTAIAA